MWNNVKYVLTTNERICINMNMRDEAATQMYESARDKLKDLLRQETEIKEQIERLDTRGRVIGAALRRKPSIRSC
jgi:peptidoglycan hydrolase CwlO-like protein